MVVLKNHIIGMMIFTFIVGCSANNVYESRSSYGFMELSRIEEALASFKKLKGEYPQNLKELFPEYIDDIPYLPKDMGFYSTISYEKSGRGQGYRLSFKFGPPGLTVCSSTDSNERVCEGFY